MADASAVTGNKRRANRIELRVREIAQLFNSMDPSPFHEKDLDRAARDFIVSWAMEYPKEQPVELLVYLEQPPAQGDQTSLLADAIHNFFGYEAEMKRRELRELMARGRVSLVIGLLFLTACFLGSQLLSRLGEATYVKLLQESLIIGGWVAMWRPLEIFLYEWWPIRRMRMLFLKLAAMNVHIKQREQSS